MNKLIIKLANGNEIVYQLIHSNKDMPIAYHEGTSKEVIKALEYARVNKIRVKIYCGEVTTGKCWHEENDTMGYIGLSKGTDAYYPILVNNKGSFGGGSLLDHCIVKIRESKGNKVIYQAHNLNQYKIEITPSVLPGYTHNVMIDGEHYSRHTSFKSAQMLKNKLS